MFDTPETTHDSYARFVRRYFRSVYEFCTEHGTDGERAEIAAQRIILDLYNLEQGALRAA